MNIYIIIQNIKLLIDTNLQMQISIKGGDSLRSFGLVVMPSFNWNAELVVMPIPLHWWLASLGRAGRPFGFVLVEWWR